MRPRGMPFPDVPKLRRALELRSWSNTDLAEKAGISPSSVSRIVSGRRASPDKIRKVAQALADHPAIETPVGRFVLDAEAS